MTASDGEKLFNIIPKGTLSCTIVVLHTPAIDESCTHVSPVVPPPPHKSLKFTEGRSGFLLMAANFAGSAVSRTALVPLQ